MADRRSRRPLVAAAMGSSAVIMASQVASRATRDTLFLSNHPASALPIMIACASVLSIVAALLATRAVVAIGPARLVVVAFVGSAVLTLGEWVLALRQPGVGAIAVYLHVAAIGPLLISAFWSVLNERFDPRAAKQAVGRIAGVGTLGGLVGGILGERLAAWTGVAGTLPALALAQGWCAWSIAGLSSRDRPDRRPSGGGVLPAREAGRRLVATPYLRNLALLVLGCSVSSTLLDFVFKAQTSGAVHQSLDLMRVFSAFYAVIAVLTFLMQALASRPALERKGLAPTIGALPAAVVVGSVTATLIPGPWSVTGARGLEGVLRGSLFRAGYELLYTPVPAAEKRATKTIVDVGCDRLGEIAGAGITALALLLVPIASTPTLLVCSALVAAVTLGLVAQLQRGYISSLEAGLRAGAVDLDASQALDMTTRMTIQRTLARGVPGDPSGAPVRWTGVTHALPGPPGPRSAEPPPDSDGVPQEGVPGAAAGRLHALRSVDPARVRAALTAAPLEVALVPDAIGLLAWDDVSQAAAVALQDVAADHVDALVDAMLDPQRELAIRRRLPGVLVGAATPRAIEGLVRGLEDPRFEVRYRCGRALARVHGLGHGSAIDREAILGAVHREAALGRRVWDSQRILDQLEKRDEDCFVDEFLRDRAGRSLEHTFTLLSLVLPREPLQIAFRGLHARDPMLRGIALEYLESVLPPTVRDLLWPHLEPERPIRRPPRPARDREQVLDDLLRSHQSIEIDLEALRGRRARGPEST